MEKLEYLSGLIHKKNAIENEIPSLIGRPALIGHVGEFIASLIFEITSEADWGKALVALHLTCMNMPAEISQKRAWHHCWQVLYMNLSLLVDVMPEARTGPSYSSMSYPVSVVGGRMWSF